MKWWRLIAVILLTVQNKINSEGGSSRHVNATDLYTMLACVIIMKEATLHLLGRDLFSTKYDGHKLEKINLAVVTQITKRSELDEIIKSLQILKYTLDENKCKVCGRPNAR